MTWKKSDGRSLRGARRVDVDQAPAPTRTIGGKRGAPVSRPKEPKPYRSEAYLRFVRTKPCVFAGRACRGAIEAHHHGKHPVGQKTDDTRCVPLCAAHHGELTDTGWIDDALMGGGAHPRTMTKMALDAASVDLLVEWIRDRGER